MLKTENSLNCSGSYENTRTKFIRANTNADKLEPKHQPQKECLPELVFFLIGIDVVIHSYISNY